MKQYHYFTRIALAIAAITAFIPNSQAQTFQWANRMGGTDYDHSSSVATDAAGNAYVTGSFAGTVSFDPGAGTANLTANGAYDVFVAKYNASGAYQWAFKIGGAGAPTAWNQSFKIAVTPAGKILVAGQFNGTADFDPGTAQVSKTAAQYGEMFIASYDAAGNYLWHITDGSSSATALTQDGAGNIYVAGTMYGSQDFDPGPGTASLTVATGYLYLAKYTASGAYVWAKNMCPLAGSLNANGIDLDKNGNIFMTGSFTGTLNFDPGPGTNSMTAIGAQDIYLAKYDGTGNLKWANHMGCLANATIPKGLTVNKKTGTATITGNHYTTMDLDPGPGTANFTTNGNYNIFLAQYDSMGAYRWAHSFGGPSNNASCDGSAVITDDAGNIFLGGHYGATVDFDPGAGVANLTTSNVFPNIVVGKYTADGAYLWAKSLGALHPQVFNPGRSDAQFALDTHGTLLVAGTFADTVDFGMGAVGGQRASAGHYDAYIARYANAGTTLGINNASTEAIALSIYPNPTTDGTATLRYQLLKAGNITMAIYDLTGREVSCITKPQQGIGTHLTSISATLSPGIYTITIRQGTDIGTTRLIVTR